MNVLFSKRYIINRKHLNWITFAICFIFGVQLNAQTKFTDDLKTTVNYHSGYNLPEYSVFTLITNDYINSIDICLSKETYGKDIWQQIYNYPEYGVSLFYSTLGNNNILGRELSLNYFYKINFFYRNKFRVYNRIGIGIGYVNRKFDFENNYINVAVGSHLNIHYNCRFGATYLLSKKIALNSGVSFDHISNANTGEPNLGINYLTGYLGFTYNINPKTIKKTPVLKPHVKKNSIYIFACLGGKHSQSLSSKYYPTSSGSFDIIREFYRGFHMGTGIDLFYDSSVNLELTKNNIEYKSIYDFQTGIHISQTIVYNKISITLQEGIYLFLSDHIGNNLFYNKAILQYNFFEKLSFRISMKSHLHILDYPEVGIGLKI